MTDPERPPDLDPEFPFPPFPGGMTAAEAEFSADLSAVEADDALLDALGGFDPRKVAGFGDLELNTLMLAWRRDIDSEPLADLIDTETAVTTVQTTARMRRYAQRSRRRRLLVPVAAAAAVLAIAFTGTGIAAQNAQPGDTLWGLTKVLYADHARSVEAAAAARIDLETANIAIAGGRIEDARKALNDAQVALKQVGSAEHLDQLIEQHRQLSAQLSSPNPAPVLPDSQASQTSVQPVPRPLASTSQLPAGTGGTTTPTTTSPSVVTSTRPSTPTSTPSSTTATPSGTAARFDVADPTRPPPSSP